MKSLTGTAKEDLSKNWVIQKTSHRSSAIPHTHEHENAKMKGKGWVVGLTENPVALKRWIIAGPEKARLTTEFELTLPYQMLNQIQTTNTIQDAN